jgi:hypothetical protein
MYPANTNPTAPRTVDTAWSPDKAFLIKSPLDKT